MQVFFSKFYSQGLNWYILTQRVTKFEYRGSKKMAFKELQVGPLLLSAFYCWACSIYPSASRAMSCDKFIEQLQNEPRSFNWDIKVAADKTLAEALDPAMKEIANRAGLVLALTANHLSIHLAEKEVLSLQLPGPLKLINVVKTNGPSLSSLVSSGQITKEKIYISILTKNEIFAYQLRDGRLKKISVTDLTAKAREGIYTWTVKKFKNSSAHENFYDYEVALFDAEATRGHWAAEVSHEQALSFLGHTRSINRNRGPVGYYFLSPNPSGVKAFEYHLFKHKVGNSYRPLSRNEIYDRALYSLAKLELPQYDDVDFDTLFSAFYNAYYDPKWIELLETRIKEITQNSVKWIEEDTPTLETRGAGPGRHFKLLRGEEELRITFGPYLRPFASK